MNNATWQANSGASGNFGNAQNPTFTLAVGGTNPLITVKVSLDSATETVTSVGWSGTSKSTAETKNVRNSTAFVSHSYIAGPSPDPAGTVTVHKSNTGINHQIDCSCFRNADQNNPCPSGDAVTSTSNSSETLTPTNLQSNDASDGMAGNTVANAPTSVTPNQRYLDGSTSVNAETGDATGASGITFNMTNSSANVAKVAVRIKGAPLALRIPTHRPAPFTPGVAR